MVKENKGITLITLAIAVIVLLILASITTYYGIDTIKSSKLTKYKTELEMVQAQVDVLYEKYKDTIDGVEIGKTITASDEEDAKKALKTIGVNSLEGYKIFDKEVLQKLGVEGIDNKFLVNIKEREVLTLKPHKYEGKEYYNLAQIVGERKIKEQLERGELTFNMQSTELTDGWKINLTDIKFSKYVGKGKVQYQDTASGKWTTVENNLTRDNYSFTIKNSGTYIVKVTDSAGKAYEQNLKLEFNNYTVDNEKHFKTLPEALSYAETNSTIKVIRDVEENTVFNINKSVIIDTNGKNIKFNSGDVSTIEKNISVSIVGSGKISCSEPIAVALIINNGILKIEDTKVESNDTEGYINATIINKGTITCDNSTITAISNEGNAVINSGKYQWLSCGVSGGKYIINDGTIKSIGLEKGGTVEINGGTITNRIVLADDSGDISLTIGDNGKALSTNTPRVKEVYFRTDLAGINCTVNFYNGVVQYPDSTSDNIVYGKGFYTACRSGYQVKDVVNSITGAKEMILELIQ